MLSEAIFEEIYNIHSPNIKLGGASKPALVVFSAIPGSGKSELTKRLVGRHGFTRIANKDIRGAMEQTSHADDIAIGDYTLWLFSRLAQQGPKSIVFDRNIDQWYELSRDWAINNDYKFVLVRIEVSRANLEKRLHRREGDKVSTVLGVLDHYQIQHEQMSRTIQADIVLQENYDLDEAVRLIAETALSKTV
jgi:predicted kinase